jgi:hypothetical protein
MTKKSLADLEQEVTRFRDTITNGSVKMSPEKAKAMVHSFRAKGGFRAPSAVSCEMLHVPNLKFHLTCTQFDAAEFKEQLLCGAQCNLMSAMLFDGLRSRDLLDGWVDMAQKWVEDGI